MRTLEVSDAAGGMVRRVNDHPGYADGPAYHAAGLSGKPDRRIGMATSTVGYPWAFRTGLRVLCAGSKPHAGRGLVGPLRVRGPGGVLLGAAGRDGAAAVSGRCRGGGGAQLRLIVQVADSVWAGRR